MDKVEWRLSEEELLGFVSQSGLDRSASVTSLDGLVRKKRRRIYRVTATIQVERS